MSIKATTLTFQEFFSYAQNEVRREIDRVIDDEDMRYALEGGKMLRPAMLLLAFKACDGKDEHYKNALESAMGVELAHSASLIHDDIMDGDIERRGKPALHVIRGIGAAILIGHKMISMAFRISLSHGIENAKIFLDTWDETLVGQLKDIDFNAHLENILNGEKPDELVREYFKIIEMKTASLFATACRAGAIEAKAPEELIELMREYGREVGMAYQLADDLVDIVNGKLEEGIIMPIIRAYGNSLNPDIVEKLKQNGTEIIEEALKRNGLDLREIYREEIKKHVERAVDIASSPLIPDTIYKNLLKEAPRYIVNAMIKNINMVI
jgi:geranylgeranyl pyrophosphate synthase